MAAPEREYFYSIDAAGRLFHDQTELTDPGFLNFFYKRLTLNGSGRHPEYPFLSPCGPELNFVRAADRPLFYRKLVDNKLFYAPDLYVDYAPDQLRFSEGGRLLHPAPVGEYAPLSADLTLRLADKLQPFGPYYALRDEAGQEHVLQPLRPPDHLRLLTPKPNNECFACGGGHASGLRLTFLFNSTTCSAATYLTPDDFFQGAPGWMHGGFISLLLDEAMGKVLSGSGLSAPTANLNVDFRKPVKLDERIEVYAEPIGTEGRKIRIHAVITRDPGTDARPLLPPTASARKHERLAEAIGLFVLPKSQ